MAPRPNTIVEGDERRPIPVDDDGTTIPRPVRDGDGVVTDLLDQEHLLFFEMDSEWERVSLPDDTIV